MREKVLVGSLPQRKNPMLQWARKVADSSSVLMDGLREMMTVGDFVLSKMDTNNRLVAMQLFASSLVHP